jgi:hypothetical protein
MTRFAVRSAVLALLLAACVADVPGEQDPGEDQDILTSEAGGKKQLAYIVIPHPDDEFEAWSLIQTSPDNYPVFLLMTHGEETSGCTTGVDGGISWFQPTLGEVVYGNPYQGKWKPSCDAARLAGFHMFLDRMAQQDSTLPYQPPYLGHVCFDGSADGATPGHIDNGTVVDDRCADVYADAKGARVIFDLGDGDLQPAEVIWALQAVRANRPRLGIPSLPEHEVMAAAFYNATAPLSGVPQYPDCDYYGHPDHHAIHAALWNTHVGAGPQYGRTCDSDPDVAGTGGRINYVSSTMQNAAFEVDPATQQRLGASVVAYGWLNPTYYETCAAGCGFSRKQSFWRR